MNRRIDIKWPTRAICVNDMTFYAWRLVNGRSSIHRTPACRVSGERNSAFEREEKKITLKRRGEKIVMAALNEERARHFAGERLTD